ncbi:MAG: hypothetical protein AB7V40_00055 [Methyloceanibacter sp.]
MFKFAKFAIAASLVLSASAPALAHPGHAPDNPILHRLVHWAASVDAAWLLALGAAVLTVTLAAALVGRRRKAKQR